jgi:hypothetical protein
MGQQQLLLIVLGVIIVGIAVVVGINLFNANAEESTKDTIASEGVNLGALAQQYIKKPTALGGGGNTLNGFTEAKMSPKLINTPTATWSWTAPGAADTVVVMTGKPKAAEYNGKWHIETTASPTRLISLVVTGS